MALDSDEGEEPSPEAMARYLSMRRHTVGVPDPRYCVGGCTVGVNNGRDARSNFDVRVIARVNERTATAGRNK